MSEQNALKRALELIENEQKNLPKYSPARMVGLQLRDIILQESDRPFDGGPAAAELVARDLEAKGMGLADCEKKIKAWADKHRNGSSAVCVTPDIAEDIIREFYGLRPRTKQPKNGAEDKSHPGLHLNATLQDGTKAGPDGNEKRPRGLSLRLTDYL